MGYYLKLYIASLAVFFLVDMLWLGLVARGFYRKQIGFLLALAQLDGSRHFLPDLRGGAAIFCRCPWGAGRLHRQGFMAGSTLRSVDLCHVRPDQSGYNQRLAASSDICGYCLGYHAGAAGLIRRILYRKLVEISAQPGAKLVILSPTAY